MKRKILLVLMFLMFLLTFDSRVRADAGTYMWVKCTDTDDGAMDFDEDNYPTSIQDWINKDKADGRYYNTFAIINSMNEGYTRPMAYRGGSGNFWEKKGSDDVIYMGPKLIIKRKFDDSYGLCWYEDVISPFTQGVTLINNAYIGDCSTEKKTDKLVSGNPISNGKCPTDVFHYFGKFGADKTDRDSYLAVAGLKNANKSSFLDKDLMALYTFTALSGKPAMMIETYSKDNGLYSYAYTLDDYMILASNFGLSPGLGTKSKVSGAMFPHSGNTVDTTDFNHDVLNWTMYTQILRIAWLRNDYYKITTHSEALLWNMHSYNDYSRKASFNGRSDFDVPERYYGPNDKEKEIMKHVMVNDVNATFPQVMEWFSLNKDTIERQYSLLNELEKEDGKYHELLTVAQKIREDGNYDFEGDSNFDDIDAVITDLDGLLKLINKLVEDSEYKYTGVKGNCEVKEGIDDDAVDSLFDYFLCEMTDTYNQKNFNGKNMDTAFKILKNTLDNQLKKVGQEEGIAGGDFTEYISSKKDKLKGYASSVGSLLDSLYKLTGRKEFADMYAEVSRLLKDYYDIQVINNCSDLLGKKLIEKFEKYYNIVKVIIPILLVGVGIVDFAKAVFASDDEKMRKAQKDFIKRIGIAVLFFVFPYLLKLILYIANKVWGIIEPGGCGLF